MANTLYRHLLKSSYLITKKYKKFWWLGLFIVFLGIGGEYQTLLDQLRRLTNQGEVINQLNSGYLFLANITDNWLTVLALALLGVILVAAVLFFYWLVVTCLSSLMRSVADLPSNLPDKNSFSIWAKWDEVKNKSKKVLGLYIVARILTYAVLAFIIIPILYLAWQSNNFTLSVLITFISFLVFVPLTMVVAFVTKYAAAYVVLRHQQFSEAWVNGWRLFFSNWLISLEMALVLLIINLLTSLAFGLVAILIFSPGFFLGVIQINAQPQLLNWLIIISIMIIVVLSAWLAAILATFQTVAWTLLFLRLNEPFPALSKLARLASALPSVIKKLSLPATRPQSK